MSSIFHIRKIIIALFLMMSTLVFAQEIKENDSLGKSKESIKKGFQRLGFGAIEYAQPIPNGDNFFGLGMQGKGGFNLKAQFFVYRHIFISGTLGTSYFEVSDKSIVGNYDETTLNHQFISLGYEIISLKKIKMGLSFSVYGKSEYENKSMTDNREAFQDDDGHARSYEAYFDYMINEDLAVYINYAYRNDKTNIISAPEIQSLFKRASFHNIGIGIKLYFGQSDIIPSVFN